MVKPTTLITAGVIILLLGIGLHFGFPKMLARKIAEAKQLRKGSQIRKDWTYLPITLDFKIHIYNYTNPNEVQKGAKPIVQDIGPFYYREQKEKVNLQDDPEQDTITYQNQNTWIFNPEGTKPLTGDETIIIPHIMILVLCQLTLQYNPEGLNSLNNAIPYVFNNPDSIFLTTTPREIFFDGIVINCTEVEEFAVEKLCNQIRAKPDGLIDNGDGTFLFSLFGARNATPEINTLTIKRGIKDITELGKMVLFNGKPTMNFWNGMPCNELKGTDSTIFPPMMGPSNIWCFIHDICRSVLLEYKEPRTYQAIKGFYYESQFRDMSTEPDLKCFCPQNDTCLKKGAMDLTKCIGAPFIATLPHCLLCDQEYLSSVDGYNPDHAKHINFGIFEPMTGVPISGARRIQLNLWLFNITKINIMKTLQETNTLVPLYWIEEIADLNKTFTKSIQTQLYKPIIYMKGISIVTSLVGIYLIGHGIFNFYKRSKLNIGEMPKEDAKATITQVSPAY